MATLKILVDVNIFEDVARRRKGFLESSRVIELVRSGVCKGYISVVTALIIFFFRKKERSDVEARSLTQKFLRGFEIVSLTSEIISTAFNCNLPEFEDNIQFVSAKTASVDYLVTRNKKHYQQGEIKVVDPDELLEILARRKERA